MTVFDSGKGTLVIPVAFAVAAGIEVVVLHVLIPWMWLQGGVLVLSVLSLLMLLGHFAIDRSHPHYATSGRLILRRSGEVVAEVDLDDIDVVAHRRRFTETAATIADGRLFLPNADGTMVDVALKSPVPARIPGLLPGNRRSTDVFAISLYVDDPDRLITRVRPRSRREL
ncbi:hypothetical protein [Rhodococcus sp. NPDC058521]|uniref:hypothetical protein n=1 Tax=Rhodococcus sp. NPDC058521 TaxID=3346536 RepID=UPI00364FB067